MELKIKKIKVRRSRTERVMKHLKSQSAPVSPSRKENPNKLSLGDPPIQLPQLGFHQLPLPPPFQPISNLKKNTPFPKEDAILLY